MKQLFLAAKYFAMVENSSEIKKEHFLKAASNFEFRETKVKNLIEKHLGIDISTASKPMVDESNIKEAMAYSTINFSPQVKDIKKFLEENGFGLNSDNLINLIEEKLSKLEMLQKLNHIKEKLQSVVYDQDIAIEAISDKLTEISYKANKDSVKAIFFFLGPPATGKTYLAEMLEKFLEGYSLSVFDMSTYSSGNQGFALMGLSKGYSNAGEGKLTSFVKENPKAICLFDEIEKAHPEIQNSLLQLMARGRAKDEHTQEEIDFSEAIFIFTSNLGSELYTNSSFLSKLKDDYSSAQSIILEAIGREKYVTSGGEIPKLKPEFVSRVAQGDTILFNKLSLEAYRKIATKSFLEYKDSFKATYGVDVVCKDMDALMDTLILSFAPLIDGRRIKSKLAFTLFDKITDFLKLDKNRDILSLEGLDVSVELDSSLKSFLDKHIGENKEKNQKFMHSLFRKNETVYTEHEISIEKKTLKLTYKNPVIKKLPKSKDFSGDGAIVFDVPDISFTDIAGHKKAKKRLLEAVEYLKNPKKLEEFGIAPPRGMLLYGPPGTGKTMLAKAFANEADLPFISTTGTEILNIEFMKTIYKRAREYAPSIIFIDEIDAIGYRDGSRADVIINQFLTELNGFSDRIDEMVFTISATNLKAKIDPAILRSGRIDLHVEIDMLDKEARGYFIDKMLEKPNDGNIDREKLITFTAGMSGADLEKVSRESALEVIRQKKEKLSEEIIIEQINIVKYGERLTSKSLEKIVEATAYHEAGHAVVSKLLMPEVKIEQITVTPRNDALGFVSYNLEDEFSNLTYGDIKNKICVAFAGRIAQMRRFGEEGLDSGASSDLKMATKYAYYAIANLGMDKDIGYINIDGLTKESKIGGVTEQEIQRRVKELMSAQKQKTEELVEENWEKIESVSEVLVKSEFIDEDEFSKIVR